MYQQFQPQHSQQATQSVKINITTEDLREIVQRLNQKPFDEKLSLITFDEFTSLELLELLNKILIQLDKSHSVNIKEELQEKTANRISEFLKVLNYPINFDMQWQQGLVQGDKKIIYPIIYFLLTRFQECEKRAYLAKFLVPFEIQEDLQGDQDIKNMNIQYKDYQAEFQVVHQQLENSQKDSMNPTELKKQITQMEQEKTQLLQKITLFKNKNTDKPEFQALLEVTNLLRREQEEEARLSEKLHVQRQQLEYSDQQLLMSQQRLIDARKNLSDDISSDDMLQNLRNEVRKNREISNDRLGLEINEKLRKLQMTEQLLVEPSMSNDEINNLENTVLQLKRTVKNLEERLSTQAKPADDKLAIYKQQAQLVMRKKEKLQEEIQKSEEEINRLDQKIQQKEAEIKKNKGPGYKSKDDFENYARNLREKTQKFKKLKDELKELQAENAVLNRTQQILNQKKDQISKQLESVEKSKGIMGFSDTRNKLEEISEKKGNIDEMKEKTLEEISKIVSNIENQLKQKKAKLQPQIKELKDLRKNFEQVEIEYNQKKKSYETGTASAIQQLSVVESDVKQLKQEVYKDDTKLTILKYQSDIIDAKSKFIMDQNAFSSALQNIQNKIPKQEQDLKELKAQRELVKENHEPSLKQMNMFRDLQKLLNVKAEVMKNQGGKTGANWKQEQHTGNVNRLVLD